MAPGPRAGATSATHGAKKRHVLFGGVVDHEIRKGEVIISEFFNDAYSMSLDGRWYPVCLYADKGSKPERRARRLDARRPSAWRAAKSSTRTSTCVTLRCARRSRSRRTTAGTRCERRRTVPHRGAGLGAAVLPGVRRGREDGAQAARAHERGARGARQRDVPVRRRGRDWGRGSFAGRRVGARALRSSQVAKIAEYSPEVAERVHGEAVESSDEEEEGEEDKERAHEMEFRARKTGEGRNEGCADGVLSD